MSDNLELAQYNTFLNNILSGVKEEIAASREGTAVSGGLFPKGVNSIYVNLCAGPVKLELEIAAADSSGNTSRTTQVDDIPDNVIHPMHIYNAPGNPDAFVYFSPTKVSPHYTEVPAGPKVAIPLGGGNDVVLVWNVNEAASMTFWVAVYTSRQNPPPTEYWLEVPPGPPVVFGVSH